MHLTSTAPKSWQKSSNHELKLYQLSPFIGRLKAAIAEDLVERFTETDGLVADPFSGSGTIPVAASYLNRRVIASDISDYSRILTTGKLFPPPSLDVALANLANIHEAVERLPNEPLDHVPEWVASFFNPETLASIVKWVKILREPKNEFFFACFLGILHHQRPGFLSYPSSHLVPYLRSRKYPPEDFPYMYEYRDVLSRMEKKIKRVYSTPIIQHDLDRVFVLSKIEELTIDHQLDAIITSPPYMNALDYYRDNRLRLWFINPFFELNRISEPTSAINDFTTGIKSVFRMADANLKKSGFCILIVGELTNIWKQTSVIEHIEGIKSISAPDLCLTGIIEDTVPDVRRSRRNCRAIKREFILVYKR